MAEGELIFPGIYRGVVRQHDDSSSSYPYMARVKVYVPQVYGEAIEDHELPWAWPCMPFGVFVIPPIESPVWVAFEQGDPRHPVYLGQWFGRKGGQAELDGDLLSQYPDTFRLRDASGGDGQYIWFVKDDRIEIVSTANANKIVLNRDGSVNIFSQEETVTVESEEGTVTVKSGQQNDDPSLDTLQSIDINPQAKTMILSAKTLRLAADNIEMNAAKSLTLRSNDVATLSSPNASGFERHWE